MTGTNSGQSQSLGHIGKARSLRKSARVQGWSAAARSLISGYVDAYTLLNFGVYASFMTGNTTSAGVHAGRINIGAAAHSLLPIPFFMLGILAGTLIVQADQARALRRLSILVAAMLVLAAAVAYAASPEWLSIVILSGAMGLLNTSITSVGMQAVSLGFMTGDLNSLARQIAMEIKDEPVILAQDPWDSHWRRIGILASLWTTFFTGAVLGAAIASHFGAWTLLLPALTLLVLTLTERATIPA